MTEAKAMSESELEELRRLNEARTQGHDGWHVNPDDDCEIVRVEDKDFDAESGPVARLYHALVATTGYAEDAAFIVAAANAMPRLLSELTRLRAIEAMAGEMAARDWRPLDSAPLAKFGETWSPLFEVGRVGMAESVALARYQRALDGAAVLQVFYPNGVRRHEDIPFTHWRPLGDPPRSALSPQPQKDEQSPSLNPAQAELINEGEPMCSIQDQAQKGSDRE